MNSLTGDAADSLTTIHQNRDASEIVVAAVAQAKGVDPLSLEPLYDVVDPDALDALFSSDRSSPASGLELSFTMADCDVVVHGDREVEVTPTEDTESSLSITRLDD